MKKSDLKEFIREEIIEILSETDSQATPEDIDAQKELNKELEKTKELMSSLGEEESTGAAEINTIADEPISEDIDAEKAEKEVTPDNDDSVVQIAGKLAKITKEMKSVNNQYKKAEGEEKESLLQRLKQLTKIKQELEGLL